MKHLLGLCLAISVAMPVSAGPASERVFSRDALKNIAVEEQVIYSHVRSGSSGEDLLPIENGEIRIQVRPTAAGENEAVVTMGQVGKLKPVSAWPVSSGNPIVPIFLESTLRSMARVTGGSEVYIRNRIKEALGKGGTITDITLDAAGQSIAAQEIVFEPFLKDKNRARMGPFANMKLVFIVSDELPGDIVAFRATTDGMTYSEEIVFDRVEAGG